VKRLKLFSFSVRFSENWRAITLEYCLFRQKNAELGLVGPAGFEPTTYGFLPSGMTFPELLHSLSGRFSVNLGVRNSLDYVLSP
jgi:hypothetical protein